MPHLLYYPDTGDIATTGPDLESALGGTAKRLHRQGAKDAKNDDIDGNGETPRPTLQARPQFLVLTWLALLAYLAVDAVAVSSAAPGTA